MTRPPINADFLLGASPKVAYLKFPIPFLG
jgi:hypothetical protein